MNEQETIVRNNEFITHISDVLVIGGGFSGLWAALKVKENNDLSVNLVDKGFCGSTSHSFFSGGGMVVLMPDDDLDEWVEDIANSNEGIADRKVLRSILENSQARMRDYETMGVTFPRRDGEYKRIRSRGAKKIKLLGSAEGGGKAIVLALHKEALKRGINIKNRIFIIDILVNEQGQAGGALGIDINDGSFHVFRAKATVIATNSGSFRGHHLASDQQGTGVFAAFNKGAKLQNAEFHYINVRPNKFEIEGSGVLPKFGARWANADGEYFMDKYDPDLKDHAPNHTILVAMAKEAKAGKAPLGFDTPSFAEEGRVGFREMMMGHGWMKLIYNKLRNEGVDFLRDKIEWNAAYETNRVGLKTDFGGKASGIEGLFAAGMARAFIPNTLTGLSIAYSTWSGYMAGETVAKYVNDVEMPEIDMQQILSAQDSFVEPLYRAGDTTPDKVVEELQKVIFPADVLILITHDKLQDALNNVENIRDNIESKMAASSIHDLIKVRETETMILSAEMTLRASMLRKESRPFIYYREDYNERDDQNWLQWIVVKKDESGFSFSTEKIPNDG
ncbi:MAG: FAD-binding protein [Bacillota bacterium]|nr:FAD-binding protein [Bacillota bacterium]